MYVINIKMLPKIEARINIPKLDWKVNVENFISLDTIGKSSSIEINLWICTMRLYCRTEKKTIGFVLANVWSKKKF